MDRLVVENEALISVNLLRQLAAADVPVVITRGRSRASAVLMSPSSGDARRRMRQAKAWLDPSLRLAFARQVVRLRVAAQRRALRNWSRECPQHRYRLLRAERVLRRVQQRLPGTERIDALRGQEGVAARVYFSALACLLPASLGFPGRRRRPPTDPVNAALSLGFTLLHARVLEALHHAGLDPAVGALHAFAHGRPSLACDLVEAERSVIEREVVRLFRQRVLEAHHFGRTADACLLAKSGRGVFFASLEPCLRQARRRTARRIASLLRQLPPLEEEGEGE
jgi:CRISPR-associated protein Cas1